MKLKKSAEAQWFCDLSADEKTNGIYSSLSFTYLIKSDSFFSTQLFVFFSPCCLFILLCIFIYLFYTVNFVSIFRGPVMFTVRLDVFYCIAQCKGTLIPSIFWLNCASENTLICQTCFQTSCIYVQESKVKGVCIWVCVSRDLQSSFHVFVYILIFFRLYVVFIEPYLLFILKFSLQGCFAHCLFRLCIFFIVHKPISYWYSNFI